MLHISLPGLLGAIAGTFVAGVNYHLFIGLLERRMREREASSCAAADDRMDAKLSLMRRLVLTADLLLFAALGYWIGSSIWG